ncbi:MAG: alginate export family protein [bacterium]|nr:alginate export family protein [bacterium]
MKRVLIAGIVALLATGAVFADDSEESNYYLNLSGFYAFNGYSQQNFFLGRPGVGGVSNNDEYSIQMFRLMGDFGFGENLKAVVRADLAQGIWGIDNDPRTPQLGGFTHLFNNKDTNFSFHVDWAYVDWTVPKHGLNVKLGRQKYKLGNMLVLDQDNDGIIVSKKTGPGKLSFAWSKMSEGQDSLSDSNDTENSGKNYGDADVYYLEYSHPVGGWSWNPYFVYYKDKGTSDGYAYIPQGFQYFNARFRPQVAEATVLGLSFKGKAGAWEFKGELDYLTGDDDIPNEHSGRNQLLDVNNGDLSGYNLYLDAKVVLGPGKLGFVAGMGSGDDDPMSGKGNINKIRTNGFFYVTEVWEDSVMPNENGITPQGLGSPASRGYREFENTTLFQVNYRWNINERFTYFVSGSVMKATETVYEWTADVNGIVRPGDLGDDSDDLGSEIDMRLDWKLAPGLTWVFRGGIFFAGDGAGYLINGTNEYLDDAYELRTTVRYSFGGLRLGK